uniref:DUF4729 domain-containing protein n=1 Tax=Timema bartmani TaxID=61472 RepID=A0A7R9I986_9NEOP|nr:unnamed protein product [Timema bartmani]
MYGQCEVAHFARLGLRHASQNSFDSHILTASNNITHKTQKDAAQQGHSTMYTSGDCEAVNEGSSPPCKSQSCGDIGSTSRSESDSSNDNDIDIECNHDDEDPELFDMSDGDLENNLNGGSDCAAAVRCFQPPLLTLTDRLQFDVPNEYVGNTGPVHDLPVRSNELWPVMCPCEGCNKNIAISGLISHFSFEHVDLPMLAVEKEDKSHFWVSPEALPLNITRCIALLLLVDSLDTRGGSLCTQHANDSRLKSGFPILVMGARLTTGPQGAAALLWAADVDSRLRYTAEATDFSTRSLSVSYSGRTESLRANQAAPAILERGLCTVVQPAVIKELAKVSGGFDLTIQIHK